MFCSNCGKKIPFGAKFCPECGGGAQAPAEEKPVKEAKELKEKKRRNCSLISGCFLLLIGIFIIFLAYGSDVFNSSDKESWKLVAGFSLLFLVIIFLLIIALFKNFKAVLPRLKKIILWLFHHPKLSIPLAVALIIAIFFFNYKWNQESYQSAAAALPLIQDSLTEVAAAKIMGDSIIAGRPVSGASWKKVRTDTEAIIKRLSEDSAPGKLRNYQKAILVWADDIAAAAKDTKTWKNLADQPGDFQIKLSESQAEEMFLSSAGKIRELKEFGDNAFKKKDRAMMRYIAAKLIVQKHWLDGILHSKKTGLLSFKPPFKLIDVALAENPYCATLRQIYREAYAECRGSADCINILNQGQVALENYCGMNWEVPAQQTPPPQTPPQEPPAQEPPQTPPAKNPPAQPPPEEPPVEPYDYQYPPEEPKRDVCIPGKTASYCAEPVAAGTNEIAASAVGFAEGQPVTQDDWDQAWQDLDEILPPEDMVGPAVSYPSAAGGHTIEGAGITTGEPAFGGEAGTPPQHSPRVQVFYDNCAALGSYVGGSNKNKARLPTTEAGYHCNYKQGAHNCWDFLTYSGGRYMGGDLGCRELGLIPR